MVVTCSNLLCVPAQQPNQQMRVVVYTLLAAALQASYVLRPDRTAWTVVCMHMLVHD